MILIILCVCWFLLLTGCGSQNTEPKESLETYTVTCTHPTYENGKCTVCGEPCTHERWNNGACITCWTECDHPSYENGRCTVCGKACLHGSYTEGVCDICGHECEHVWNYDRCTICNLKCRHPMHDSETQICTVCGLKVAHHYIKGKCVCGTQYEMWATWPDRTIMHAASQHGTVDEIELTVPCYDHSQTEDYTKWISVYLPYQYDPARPYNVIFLYHGGGGNHLDWMSNPIDFEGRSYEMVDIYDNMIERKLCDPFIAVSINSGYTLPSGKTQDCTEWHNGLELRNDIIPFIVNNYSTYAASARMEDIQRARSHFAVGGDSNGSLYAYKSGMFWNFDLIGNYLFISGDAHSAVKDRIKEEDWKNLSIDTFFCCAGDYDDQRRRVERGYTTMITEEPERLTENENAFYLMSIFGHDWVTFSIAFYNAIQVMFP